MKKEIVARAFYGILAGVLAVGLAGGAAHAQSAGVTSPSVPGSVSAQTTGSMQVYVSWDSSEETSGSIAGYYVYRNGAKILSTGDTSFTDTLANSGNYVYTVAAYDTRGMVSAQSDAAWVTVTRDTTPPTAPANLVLSGTTTTNSYYHPASVTISWDWSQDDVSVAGYRVYRNGFIVGSSQNGTITDNSFTDSLSPGTYTYAVDAYDDAGNISPRSATLQVTVSVDSAAPTVPRNLAIAQTDASTAVLTWASSTDNVAVTGYNVFRDGVQVDTTQDTSYSDTNLATWEQHFYTVQAFDAAGNVSAQVAPSVRIMIQPVGGPTAPTGVHASVTGASTITLSWLPSADTFPITGYAIYRNDAQIATATSSPFNDLYLSPGAYTYGIVAMDSVGANSPTSTIVSVTLSSSTIPVTPPFTPAPTQPVTPSPVPSPVGAVFTQTLYYGLRGAQVMALQQFLISQNYLASTYATGFYGNLTAAAVTNFQCAKGIVCSGGAGAGMVGPRTRAALNAAAAAAQPGY